MENTNERFDKMMRGAFSGFGTSASFTRRLMVRIEREKEIARARRVERVGLAAAIGVFVLALTSLVLLATYFRSEATLSVGYADELLEHIGRFFSDLFSQIQLSTVVNMVVVCLAVFAVLSWDAVLKIFYPRRK